MISKSSFLLSTSLLSISAFFIISCANKDTINYESALESISEKDLASDIRVLSSDEYEGRKPGSKGEELATAYIAKRFREAGLEPGNIDGTYFQTVPLLGIVPHTNASVKIKDQIIQLKTPEEFAARAFRNQNDLTLNESELVFGGYGIEAPEYGWNDYEGIDLKGKTVLLLRQGEPSRPLKDDPNKMDPTFFKGAELTVHSHSIYKRDIAFSKGADAVIFISGIGNQVSHDYFLPAYQSESFGIESKNSAAIDGSIELKRLRELLSLSGYDLDTLYEHAQKPGFRPIPLGMSISIDLSLKSRIINSRNVIGIIPGSDPKLRDEYIIYSAHWDGKGQDTTRSGDRILNGAMDNAFGVSEIIQIANAFRKLSHPPKRSVLFIATTGEEYFFLGAKYYVQHPVYPIEKATADINLDISYPYGPTSDVIIYGDNPSRLSNLFLSAGKSGYKRITADPYPSQGFNGRMDHVEFIKAKVPAVSPWMGIDITGQPEGSGKKLVDEYFRNNYHKPSDEFNPAWDYSGSLQYTRICFLVGLKIAQEGLK